MSEGEATWKAPVRTEPHPTPSPIRDTPTRSASVVHGQDHDRIGNFRRCYFLIERENGCADGKKFDRVSLPAMIALVDIDADYPFSFGGGSFELHAFDGDFAGFVHGRGEIFEFDVLAGPSQGGEHTAMSDMVDTGAHDHFHRPVAGMKK